jgi:hypothetical protein
VDNETLTRLMANKEAMDALMSIEGFRNLNQDIETIINIEPELFRKVTGLKVKDFDLLVSLGLFNSAHMNAAVYNFKRYEDASLVYTGIDKHEGQRVGGWDTVISKEDYHQIFENKAIW